MAEIADRHWAARPSLAYFIFALERREGESTNRATREPAPVITSNRSQTVLTPANLAPDVSFLTGIDDFPSPSRWLYDFGTLNEFEDLMTAYSGLIAA